jgi:diacylglycerol O-acyltransferase
VEKLRPDDHFLQLLEGDQTPMHIGSLLLLDVPQTDSADAANRLKDHLIRRLRVTPLLRQLRQAPLSFDSDVWVSADDVDFDRHIVIHGTNAPRTDRDLHEFVEEHVMRRLDLRQPPFLIHILNSVEDDRIALYMRVHHSLTDGVGFQTVLGLLSDDPVDHDSLSPADLSAASDLPARHEWLAESVQGFREQREREPQRRAAKRAAIEALKDESMQRSPTPELAISGPTSMERSYTTITLPFHEMRQVARSLDATLNDLFLACVGRVMRVHLQSTDDLPDTPVTTNSARSYRRPEHGSFGNRIVAIHPHVATNIDNPIDALRAIQASMAIERRRTEFDEALLNSPENPFGPLVRRRRFAERRSSGTSILPGNISVSNVPGPDHLRSYAGFRQLSNHPTPLLGTGRALNFTARRNADSFDVGLMTDPTKIPDAEQIASLFRDAFNLYANIASADDTPDGPG